jgi:hypothetical protein
LVGLNNNLHLAVSCLKLLCGSLAPFEVWVVSLKRRDYLEDVAINGKIEMHLEKRVLGCVSCIHLGLSGD